MAESTTHSSGAVKKGPRFGRLNKLFVFIASASLVLGLGLLFLRFAPSFRLSLSQDASLKAKSPRVGSVSDAEGLVKISSPSSEGQSLQKGQAQTLYNLQSLATGHPGQARVLLDSGAEFKVLEDSQIVFELWDAAQMGTPLYLNIIKGNIEVLKSGPENSVYVLKDKSLYLLGQTPPAKNFEMVIQNMSPPAEPLPEAAPIHADQGTDTLSNSYMDEVIEAQKNQFQKCQANSLRNQFQDKGELLIGLTISPRGTVDSVKILSSTFKDPELPECAVSVFKRIKFRPFSGPEIVRSYPLTFN